MTLEDMQGSTTAMSSRFPPRPPAGGSSEDGPETLEAAFLAPAEQAVAATAFKAFDALANAGTAADLAPDRAQEGADVTVRFVPVEKQGSPGFFLGAAGNCCECLRWAGRDVGAGGTRQLREGGREGAADPLGEPGRTRRFDGGDGQTRLDRLGVAILAQGPAGLPAEEARRHRLDSP